MLKSALVGIKHRLKRFRRLKRQMRSGTLFTYQTEIGWVADQGWTAPYRDVLAADALDGYDYRRILDRRFQLAAFAGSVKHLRGSTAECGVLRGVGSGVICETLQRTYEAGENHFGFDSFAGVACPSEADEIRPGKSAWQQGQLAVPMQIAQRNLSKYAFCRLVRGWIPDCLAEAADHRFRLVHIDVDLYEATRQSLEFFYPRLVPGGVIVLDDHGFANCPGARQAANEFFADRKESVIDLATGQGFVTKL